MNRFFVAIVAVLWLIPGLAQQPVDPSAGSRVSGSDPSQQIAPSPSSDLIGTWEGPWDSPRATGGMEVEIQSLQDVNVTGRVRVSYVNRNDCSSDWENMTGVKKGDQVFAEYDLKGSCGKVSAVFRITPGNAKIMPGTWTNAYGGRGKLQLTKKALPPLAEIPR